MQKKPIIAAIAVLLMFTLLATMAAAATATQVILTPTSGSRQSGTITVTVEVNGTMYNCLNTTAGSAGTGCSNITAVGINYTRTSPTSGTETQACINASNANNGSIAVNWTCSFNTNILSDDAAYTFTAYIYNGTTLFERNTTTVTNVMSDNTVPTVSIDQAANTLITSGSITATVSNVSYCRIRFSTNQLNFNMTENSAGTSCTYALSASTIPDSTYDVTITVFDNLNSTTATKSFPIRLTTATIGKTVGKAQIANVVQAQQAQQTKNWTILIIVLIVGYLVSQGKFKNMFK